MKVRIQKRNKCFRHEKKDNTEFSCFNPSIPVVAKMGHAVRQKH